MLWSSQILNISFGIRRFPHLNLASVRHKFTCCVFLLFQKGTTDQTDASRDHKTACLPLSSEQELTFPDLDDTSMDVTDFPDDLDEDDAVSQEELSSVWEEINKLTPLGSVITWPSKPNKKVPVKREPRSSKGLVQIYILYRGRSGGGHIWVIGQA